MVYNPSIFALKVEDLNVLDDIACSVSEFELEKEFNQAFVSKKQDTKDMMMKWGKDLKEVDKFVRQILELHRAIDLKEVSNQLVQHEDLKSLVSQMKQLFS